MTLYDSPAAQLTYSPADATLHLSYHAAELEPFFGPAYAHALRQMHTYQVQKLLLDLKRNAPSSDDHEFSLLAPLQTQQPLHPVFIAAVLTEGQYQYQISNCPTPDPDTIPAQVEFNYFTSRREATSWLRSL